MFCGGALQLHTMCNDTLDFGWLCRFSSGLFTLVTCLGCLLGLGL